MDALTPPPTPTHTRIPRSGPTSRSPSSLFVLTALEVGAYEVVHRGQPAGGSLTLLEPVVVPVLLILSAVKFALVAMFYMHLKQDGRLFSSVFVFPLVIAAVIILALIALEAYHFAFRPPGDPAASAAPRRSAAADRALRMSWSLHPTVVFGMGLLGALYFYGIGPWRRARGLPPRRAGGCRPSSRGCW